MSQPARPAGAAVIGLQDILHPLWKEWKRILLISCTVGVVVLGVNFLLPKSYKSTATLLPDTERNRLGTLSQFAGLASLAGVSVSGNDVPRLYPAILSSETLLENVVEKKYQTLRFPQPVSLIEYFEINEPSPAENLDKAITSLQKSMTVELDPKTNIVMLSVELPEPQLAADVLNAAIAELDNFLRTKKITSASEQRKWIEDRLRQVEQDLRNAEDALRNFREKNRRVIDSPTLVLQQERLAREVQVESTMYVELKKQYELAKIEEIKNLSVVNVLDEGRAPVKKDKPHRATNAAIFFVLALLGTSAIFVVRENYGQQIREFVRGLRGGSGG